ncbi:MAG: hypothetical protein PHN78_05140 [Dehalococcoidales bacterium]|nr:hypothetical protein [Dehalococcoidales bacterium]
MDPYCQRCGEPFDIFYVTDEMTDEEKNDFHKGISCPTCRGKEAKKHPFRASLMSELSSVLGDDIDGLATEMEDAEWMLGDKFWE